ncbi:hypothetical protein SLS62_008488 [Diatrype stigma]|uniref:EKC/KEOPS complex subunit BUD32 n=1 Tax=Diatrype stigma TaxID=117547 RepID=A0AAN9UVR2_9PEZI
MARHDGDSDEYMETGLSDVEDIHDYRPGGFHPVNYGDVLDGRFEVISKLGQGGYATVWLCLDISSTKPRDGDGDGDDEDEDEIQETDEDNQQKWRAVKIVRARESPPEARDWPPLRLKQHLESLGLTPADWEEHHVALPLEHFWIDGPNGRHLCEVGAVQGSSIAHTWEVRMPADGPARIKTLLYGAGQALQFLHSHGICHGDFTPGNVLMRVDGDALANLSRGEMLALLEERGDAPITKTPSQHAPLRVHEPADLSSLPLKDGAVAVVDFGECWWAAEQGGRGQPEWSGVPVEFAAPEALYNCGVSTASDVWSFACTIVLCLMRLTLFTSDRNRAAGWYEALLDSPMPETYRQAQAKEIRRQLAESVGVTEEQRQWAEGELEKLKAGEGSGDGEAHMRVAKATAETGHDNPITALIAEERVYKDEESGEKGEKTTEVVQVIPEDEARVLGDLLEKVFQWDPKDRIDIDAVLAHEFFEDKENPGSGLKFTSYGLMKLDSTPAPAGPDAQQEEVVSGTESSDTSDHGAEEKEQPAEEQPVQEPRPAAPPGQQPTPTTTQTPMSGLSRFFYSVGRSLDNIRSSTIRHWKELEDWEPTKQELSKLLLGTVTVFALWYLVNFLLIPTLNSRRLAADQQQGLKSNTLFMPITLRSSTSEYSRGFLAFMAPKAEDDANSTCSCIVARGL